ncbi:MAG: beta-ketoacyl-[acyl-carrier-protein] synthase family protein [Blastocatellia bacterium]
MMKERRIVITGIGAITSIGVGKEEFWNNLLAGRTGIADVELFDTSAYNVHRGAEVKGFDAQQHVFKQDVRAMGRASHFAIAAARLALQDASFDLTTINPDRVGVSIGTTTGEQQEIDRFDDSFVGGEMEREGGGFISRYSCHVISGHVASEFSLSGINLMIAGACAAGNYAIAQAFDVVRSRRAEVMLAGGTETFSRVIFTGFARLGAIAPEVCQPFDRNRKGMIPGEGAAVLVLETVERAMKRGARIYAEIGGYGLSCDAYHITAPHPEGEGAARAMEKGLAVSGLKTDDVSYISAHGTGTPVNDRLETVAIKRVFKEGAYTKPVSSIKSMLGHTMGAASAIEAGACALAVYNDRIPPTMNLEEADPECDLDYVPNKARECNVDVAMNNAYGFGGYNSSLILRKFIA